MPPQQCNICSFRQPKPMTPRPVFHRHFSSTEIRITQGVEWSTTNRPYMCPTCEEFHPSRLSYGLNVCLGDSQLHEFHLPQDPSVKCRPDSLHVDWITIPGATIPTLDMAWQVDYAKYNRPMRVLLVAGINDLLKGGTFSTVTRDILALWHTIEEQNSFHPESPNELVVATLLNPPKLTWFPDTGPSPPGHVNRLDEIRQINDWILEFNREHGHNTPRFHRFGVKVGRRFVNGEQVPLHVHQLRRWRQSEAVGDMVHLNDYWRTRLGASVVNHFKGELDTRGVLYKQENLLAFTVWWAICPGELFALVSFLL